MPKAPLTIARLSQTCELYATTGGNLDATALLASVAGSNDLLTSSGSFDLVTNAAVLGLMGNLTKLGSVVGITLIQTRENKRIYSLGANSFEPAKIVPQSITSALKIKKVVLYNNGDALGAFGFVGWNLFYQQVPIVIRQVFHNPHDNTSFSVLYLDCWFKDQGNVSFDVDTNTDNLVKQDVSLDCGKIISTEALLATTNSGSLSFSNIKLLKT